MVELRFVAGTLEVRGISEPPPALRGSLTHDRRSACLRAPASSYAEVVRALLREGIRFEDRARNYEKLQASLKLHRVLRPFQREAMEAWQRADAQGVVILPTGAGKSHVGVLAIADRCRSALVVAPTLDLVRQWYDLLRKSFDTEVGVVGGGEHTIRELTVATYDSAYLHMEHLGARFGLIVFDECHHLPGATYALAARLCLAPFRLGLTATFERADGREQALSELIGPVVYRKDIVELSGRYLADYDVETIEVELAPEERTRYKEERALYVGFLRKHKIVMSGPGGFRDFIMRAARSREGQRALLAYRRQRELAFAASQKLDYVELLLEQHKHARTLVFTQDNATAYSVSRKFLIPAITHQTRVRERSEILERFADGRYNAVVTSKVLNEGVDVPEASVAIIVSGSGSVREHVQRLGRILRRKGDKRAVLYELVSADTSEQGTSTRRREHGAYQ